MKFLYYILLIMLSFSLGSCKDDIPGSDNPNIGGITLTLTSGNMETRTNLTSTAATQNVETVYIALYKGNNDNATFVAAQDFGWEKTENVTSYEKQVRPLQFTDLVSGEYIILAVGLDADSKTTYFTSLEDFKNKLETANTLANAKAIAANAASIATSELFAGWNTFTYEPDIENEVEVEMKRRVAGVLCYLKDIPSTITKSDGTYTVTKVQLKLFTNQNSAIRLARKEKGENNIGLQEDFGDTPLVDSDSDILMSYNLTGLSSKDGLYEIPVAEGESRLPNTILMSAYMLPIEYSPDENNKSTLTLEVWGTNDNLASGASPEEVCIQSFPVLQNGLSSGNDAEKYSIYPNYIYHIGQKPDNNSTEGDYPESLAGEKITVTAKEWDNEEVNVEFPTVPVNATMELVNEDGMAYNTDKYIFDCIGIDDVDYDSFYPRNERLKLKIEPSLLKSPWKITITTSNSNPFCYISSGSNYYLEYPSDGSLANGENETYVDMLLTSYALENGLDIREAVITLYTYDNNGLNIIASTEMTIKQYNAIIIKTDKGKRGFARYDWGTKRNLNTGEIDYSGEQSIWGYYTIGALGVYYGSTDGNIFGKAGGSSSENGEDNYYDAKETAGSDPDKDLYKGFYGGCAIYKCGVKYLQVENSVKQSLDKIWYLPARFELQSFLKNEYENIIIGERYWTSTARVEDTYCNSRDIKGDLFDDKNIAWVSKSVRRDNKYYMRQACIISEK